MADIKVIPIDNPKVGEEKAAKESFMIGINFRLALKWSCIFCAIAIIFFIWQQWDSFSFAEPIDSSVWGTFGDFVGGVLERGLRDRYQNPL